MYIKFNLADCFFFFFFFSHYKASLNHCQFNNFSQLSASSNTASFTLVSWSLNRKLVESLECTNARLLQESVRSIEGLTEVSLYCWRYCLNIHSYISVIQEQKSWYANYKMQNPNFWGSAKFMHGKMKKQIWYIYIYV